MIVVASTRGLPDPVPCPTCGKPSRLTTAVEGECLRCTLTPNVTLPPPGPNLYKRVLAHNAGRTHWDGCEAEHLVCALWQRLANATQSTVEMAAEILGLRDTVSKLVTERDDWKAKALAANAEAFAAQRD